MTAPAPTPVPAPPGDVAIDLACVACGYNLKGLPRAGTCPECGTQIDLAFRPDLLRHASPQYVASLMRALTVNRVAWWLTLVVLTCSLAADAVVAFGLTSIAWMLDISHLTSVLPACTFFLAVWMFATPDPRVLEEPSFAARRLARLFALAAGITALALAAANLAGQPTTSRLYPLPPGPATTASRCLYAMHALYLVLLMGLSWSTLLVTRAIALRAPDEEIAAKCRFWASGTLLIPLGGVFTWMGLVSIIYRVGSLRADVELAQSDHRLAEVIRAETSQRRAAAAQQQSQQLPLTAPPPSP